MPKLFGSIEARTNQSGGDIASALLGGIFQIMGWELHDEEQEYTIQILCDETPTKSWTERYRRPDLEAAYPELARVNSQPGFRVSANSITFLNGRHVLTCLASCGMETAVLGRWEVVVANGPEFVVYAQAHVNPYSHRNLKKLDRLKVLQCPCCGSPLAMRSELSLSCSSCSRLFPVRDFAAIMVLGEPEYPIDEAALSSPASPVSGTYSKTVTRSNFERWFGA